MSKKDQTLDTVGKRCNDCKIIAYITYTCSSCQCTICAECMPTHQLQCNLINHNHNKSPTPSTAKKPSVENSAYQFQCSLCGKRELQKIVCPDCHLQFCINHRKQFSHQCKMNRQVSPSRQPNSQASQKQTNSQSTQKSQQTQNTRNLGNGWQWIHSLSPTDKIARLKKQNELLKKAVGNSMIPLPMRFYFEFLLPNENVCLMFVNKNNSLKQSFLSVGKQCQLDISGGENDWMKRYSFMTEEGEIIDWNKQINTLKNYSTILVLLN